uniref:Uncharacterized protein n=1 Tax=Schizaphis graminum TaxID=13262 RepID=A0A2S2PDH7_SCHGA
MSLVEGVVFSDAFSMHPKAALINRRALPVSTQRPNASCVVIPLWSTLGVYQYHLPKHTPCFPCTNLTGKSHPSSSTHIASLSTATNTNAPQYPCHQVHRRYKYVQTCR